MPRPYYILASRDHDTPWGVAFGAYDKADVVAERQDYRDHDHKAAHIKVIRCDNAKPETVNAAIAALNEKA